MLTYHGAALNKTVAAIVGMTFLDQREQQVRDETNLNLLISRVGIPLTVLADRTPLRRLRMPMAPVRPSDCVPTSRPRSVTSASQPDGGRCHTLSTHLRASFRGTGGDRSGRHTAPAPQLRGGRLSSGRRR